jgi:hypothetical protein
LSRRAEWIRVLSHSLLLWLPEHLARQIACPANDQEKEVLLQPLVAAGSTHPLDQGEESTANTRWKNGGLDSHRSFSFEHDACQF